MVALDASQRPTIEEIAQHPWLNGETATPGEIVAEFK